MCCTRRKVRSVTVWLDLFTCVSELDIIKNLLGEGNSMPRVGEKLHWFLCLQYYWAAVGGLISNFISVSDIHTSLKCMRAPPNWSLAIQHFDCSDVSKLQLFNFYTRLSHVAVPDRNSPSHISSASRSLTRCSAKLLLRAGLIRAS